MSAYGPTENTTFTCCHRITAKNLPLATVPIGVPIRGTEVFVFDEDGSLVSPGTIGELHTGGAGVALGYLSEDESGAFFEDPMVCKGLIYRTGDLVRENHEGNLEFVGRKDSQIKLRGYRISLDEITRTLLNLEGVADAAVTVQKFDGGDELLVAFVLLESEKSIDKASIFARLAETLPSYMIPNRIDVGVNLPMTTSGKIDKKQLRSTKIQE
jgi:acyl-coenzyme A synthetase/AMP-(fatty) acid ligase